MEQMVEVLKEGVAASAKHGLSLDPACFVSALRACSGLRHPAGVISGSGGCDGFAGGRAAAVAAAAVTAATAKGSVARPETTPGIMTTALKIIGAAAAAVMQAGKREVDDGTNGVRRGEGGLSARRGVPGGVADAGGGMADGGGGSGGGSGGSSGGSGVARSDVKSGQKVEEVEEKSRSRRDEDVWHPLETTASLLRRMEAEAGVVPDASCSNVAMESAVQDRQWSVASRLFDEAERRFMQASGQAGAPNASRDKANAGDRGPGELRKTAITSMAPTALSYHLALQACASASADMVAGNTAPENVSVGETGRETTIPEADRELRAIIPPLHEVAEEEEKGEGEGEGKGQETRRRTNTETRLVAARSTWSEIWSTLGYDRMPSQSPSRSGCARTRGASRVPCRSEGCRPARKTSALTNSWASGGNATSAPVLPSMNAVARGGGSEARHRMLFTAMGRRMGTWRALPPQQPQYPGHNDPS